MVDLTCQEIPICPARGAILLICVQSSPEGLSTWLVLYCHNPFPSRIRAVCQIMVYYNIPANLLCHPLEAPGTREAVASFV